jgi:hypothetical protein
MPTMPAPNGPTTLTLLAFLPIIVWRMYGRFKRLIGRQHLKRWRPWLTLVVYVLVLGLLTAVAHEHLERMIWMVAGLAVGAGLGIHGLRKTKFEATSEGLFYTPNAHIGIAISSLFILRMIYRFVEVLWLHPPTGAERPDDFTNSPATLIVIGLMGGYYVAYSIGLLRWRPAVPAPSQTAGP